MRQLEINGYKRITKLQARTLVSRGYTVYMEACNLAPGNMFTGSPAHVNKQDLREYRMSFNDYVSNFEYWNCNNETGLYASYYVKEY